MNKTIKFLFFFLGVIFSFYLNAQNDTKIKVYDAEYKTYAFSDPNPIPVFDRIYPYFRYDVFSNQSKARKWTVIEMENDFLKIKILPGIGGKIWSVIDKTNGKELFYDNDVVKFRDISLRGPWTSGGIEFNYGVIGHAPSCAFPVNYLTTKNADGSVSCIINDLDLLTRTFWSVEINLPKDKGWFTTRSFWHNKTSAKQPYYNWVNTGILQKDDLKFICEGTHSIDHHGIVSDWPINTEKNKNLSLLAENDFGKNKSYHIIGRKSPYFGAFWSSDDAGVMQFTNRDDKLGRKIFLWAFSGQGKIWENLLTNKGEQYIEMQSGRLFNQNYASSSLTPFKQVGFTPYSTDVWTEYWFPFKKTGGVSNVCLEGVVHVMEVDNTLKIFISPLQNINDTLRVFNKNGDLLFKEKVSLNIAESFSLIKELNSISAANSIVIGKSIIWDKSDDTLQRPVKNDENFNWNSSYGQYLLGRDKLNLRLYAQADTCLRKSLEMDSDFVPALTEMARMQYHRMNYDSAFYYAKRALSIDTYDPEANYEYGRSALKLNKTIDALDGFEVAALTPFYRSAAYTEISKIYILEKRYPVALEYAEKSMILNQYNIEGLQLMYLLYSLVEQTEKQDNVKRQIQKLDPLNYFVLFEEYIAKNTTESKLDFCKLINNELPEQIYLELSIWYSSLGLVDKSIKLLQMAPDNSECKYWLAFLCRNTDEASQYLSDAVNSDPYLVFPFREESMDVFRWANGNSNDWKPSYYMALIHSFRNNIIAARKILTTIEIEPDFAPYYMFRSQLSNQTEEGDVKKAIQLNSNEWRYIHKLVNIHMQNENYEEALKVMSSFYKSNKNHYLSAGLYVEVLIANRKYESAESILKTTEILPFEDAILGRQLYQKTKLLLAIKAMSKNEVKLAAKKIDEARLWPVNLGVGKPYDDLIDSRMEDWLCLIIAEKKNDKKGKEIYLNKVATSARYTYSPNTVIQCVALKAIGEKRKAEALFDKWIAGQTNETIKDIGKSFYNEEYTNNHSLMLSQVEKIINIKKSLINDGDELIVLE